MKKDAVINPNATIREVYEDYLEHLKLEHPEVYAKTKAMYDWYRPPIRPA